MWFAKSSGMTLFCTTCIVPRFLYLRQGAGVVQSRCTTTWHSHNTIPPTGTPTITCAQLRTAPHSQRSLRRVLTAQLSQNVLEAVDVVMPGLRLRKGPHKDTQTNTRTHKPTKYQHKFVTHRVSISRHQKPRNRKTNRKTIDTASPPECSRYKV